MTMPQGRPDQFAITEAYKQVKLNARQRALSDALELAKIRGSLQLTDITELLANAGKIEQYLLDGIEAPDMNKPMIHRATVGPQ